MPIYEAIAKQIFKDKPPTPFRIPPGLRLVKFSYEGGTIDQVFKPGTEPGAEGYKPVSIDGSTGEAVERRRRHRRPDRPAAPAARAFPEPARRTKTVADCRHAERAPSGPRQSTLMRRDQRRTRRH